MKYVVYLIITSVKNKTISYVGYTNNIEKRLKLHNSSKGAKFTKGKKWKLIYSFVLLLKDTQKKTYLAVPRGIEPLFRG